jgi:hypothetical protein
MVDVVLCLIVFLHKTLMSPPLHLCQGAMAEEKETMEPLNETSSSFGNMCRTSKERTAESQNTHRKVEQIALLDCQQIGRLSLYWNEKSPIASFSKKESHSAGAECQGHERLAIEESKKELQRLRRGSKRGSKKVFLFYNFETKAGTKREKRRKTRVDTECDR